MTRQDKSGSAVLSAQIREAEQQSRLVLHSQGGCQTPTMQCLTPRLAAVRSGSVLPLLGFVAGLHRFCNPRSKAVFKDVLQSTESFIWSLS